MTEFLGFIGSCARTQERNASSELYYLLTEILGYQNVDVYPDSAISGLFIAKFEEDPTSTLQKIEIELEKDRAVLRYTLKLVPVQYRVTTALENLREIAKGFSTKIKENDTWKVNLRRRHSQISRDEIITNVADEIKIGKVMLDKPQHYIIVEILGKWTYLSISSVAELSISQDENSSLEDDFTF
jgi:tRNA(Ser,Leu) C12 N-acetylase TAN1